MNQKIYYFLYHFFWLCDHLSPFPKSFLLFKNMRKSILEDFQKKYAKENTFLKMEERHISFLSKADLESLPLDHPVVFRGLGKEILAARTWSFDYLKTRFSSVKQPFYHHNGKKIVMDIMPFEEGINGVLTKKPPYSYLGGTYDILNLDKSLRDDLELHKISDWSFFKSTVFLLYKLFISADKAWAPSHSEHGPVLNFLIKGKKKWIIVDPKDSWKMFPLISRTIFLQTESFKQASKLKETHLGITAWEVDVDEGDVLYLPPHFWHYVENNANSISVEFKWSKLPMLLRNPFLTLILLTSRNPNIIRQFVGKAFPSLTPKNDIF